MAGDELLECSFFVPLRRDAEISDGAPHHGKAWRWLDQRLFDLFDGRTIAPGVYQGVRKSPITGRPIHDQTRRYIVAARRERVHRVRALLRQACGRFHQQCIYLSVAGIVEFVGPPDEKPH